MNIFAHLFILIGGATFAVGTLIFLFYQWSRPRGCDHTFPKNNEINPKCDKCGKRIMQLIEELKLDQRNGKA